MGKAGKVLKRRRLERELGTDLIIHGFKKVSKPPSYLNEEEGETDGDKRSGEGDGGSQTEEIAKASLVLDMLSRRLDLYGSKAMKPLRTALFPLIQMQQKRRAFFETPEWVGQPQPSDEQAYEILNTSSLALLQRVALRFTEEADGFDFSAPINKSFRKSLHPLVLEQYRREGKPLPAIKEASLSARISTAFRRRDWAEALTLLRLMEMSNEEQPKLGALQRWVRDCDLALSLPQLPSSLAAPSAGEESLSLPEGPSALVSGGNVERSSTPSGNDESLYPDGLNTSLLLLDGVLRVAAVKNRTNTDTLKDPLAVPLTQSAEDKTLPPLPGKAVVQRHPFFTVPIAVNASSAERKSQWNREEILERVNVVSHVKGPFRRPPSPYDLSIHATAPGTIVFEPEGVVKPQRYDVPFVPGAFLMTGVLSPGECRQIVEVAEAVGYVADAVDGIDNMNWLADESLLGPIFERCRNLMPQEIGGGKLGGVNARWRLFRYYSGAIYRPHIDGAWPGSGLDQMGKYTDDAFGGTMYSKLTFLIYLNGGFEGGATTFFLPREGERGYIEARGVRPQEGAILCFPHGDAEGSLVHEGSAVAEGGVKYIIRTDALYTVK